MKSPEKGFAPILIILLVLLIGAVGYFVYVTNLEIPESVIQQPAPVHTKISPVTTSTTTDVTTNWKTYTNPELGYSIQYPPNWHYWAEKDGQATHIKFGELGKQYAHEEFIDDYAIIVSTSPANTSTALPIKDFIKNRIADGSRSRDVLIDGIKTVEVSGYLSTSVLFQYKKTVYDISMETTTLPYPELDPIFSAMLTTFRIKRD